MTAYVIRRVVWGIALLIIVCALTFILFPRGTRRCCARAATPSRT